MTYDDFKRQTNDVPSVFYDTFNNGDVTRAQTGYSFMDTEATFEKILAGCNPKFVNFELNWNFNDSGLTPDFADLKAYARRAPGDTPNEKIGRQVALRKVLFKYHKIRHRHFREIVHDFRMVLARLEYYCAKKDIDLTGVPTVEEFIAQI